MIDINQDQVIRIISATEVAVVTVVIEICAVMENSEVIIAVVDMVEIIAVVDMVEIIAVVDMVEIIAVVDMVENRVEVIPSRRDKDYPGSSHTFIATFQKAGIYNLHVLCIHGWQERL